MCARARVKLLLSVLLKRLCSGKFCRAGGGRTERLFQADVAFTFEYLSRYNSRGLTYGYRKHAKVRLARNRLAGVARCSHILHKAAARLRAKIAVIADYIGVSEPVCGFVRRVHTESSYLSSFGARERHRFRSGFARFEKERDRESPAAINRDFRHLSESALWFSLLIN